MSTMEPDQGRRADAPRWERADAAGAADAPRWERAEDDADPDDTAPDDGDASTDP
jgi:hypothetical protein